MQPMYTYIHSYSHISLVLDISVLCVNSTCMETPGNLMLVVVLTHTHHVEGYTVHALGANVIMLATQEFL